MKRYKFKYVYELIAALLLSVLAISCQDDELYSLNGESIVKGEPATIKLKVKLCGMDEYTRSIIDDDDAVNFCENLWIGIYDDEGNRIYRELVTDVANRLESTYEWYTLNLTIRTTSTSQAKIVGVANVDSGEGLASINDDVEDACSMRTLLENADTYEKFNEICAMRPDGKDVNLYASSFMMSGGFAETMSSQGEVNITPIDIKPGETDLTTNYGAIYLQRVIAYNKFVITSDENINMTLNTWQVCNIPAGGYLIERSTNACDDYKGSGKVYNNSNLSHVFTAINDEDGNMLSKYFEFYQMENKHKACAYKETGDDYVGIRDDSNLTANDWYSDREREYKDDNLNTGIYKSLVNDRFNSESMANNNASYVVFNATIEYYINDDDEGYNREHPDEALPEAKGAHDKQIHRTANVNYTIHLGYCEGKKRVNGVATVTSATAQDFNCRRNSKYLYNVKIKGVKNLVVEARNLEEPNPSTDGTVEDAYTDVSHLDSHYCTFNVKFSNYERQKLGFRIFSPYNGKTYYYYRAWDGTITKSADLNNKMLGRLGPLGENAEDDGLFEWIKFKPISDGTELADYGDGSDLWTLEDMCAPTAMPHPDCSDVNDTEERYYTVFIDEYVYHFDDVGDEETSWPNYVNQDDRCVEIINNSSLSQDLETSYSFCKYVFEQKSIQTYYNSNVSQAVGVEHEDETYCLNYRWDILNNSSGKDTRSYYDYNNGLYNQWYYLTTRAMSWSDIVDESTPDYVIGDSNDYHCSHPDANYPVCSPKTISATALAGTPSPNDSRVFYANSICMNRNRDLNGDNEISVDEMRWYMPPTNIYIQIGIGQAELPSPLIKFTDMDQDVFSKIQNPKTDRDGKYNYHLITSDYQYFFSEECVSNGNDPLTRDLCQTYGVRCVRNLGTNISKTPVKGDNPVPSAYTHDATERTFTQDKFTDISLRGYNNSALAPHNVADPASRPYYKFEYAKDYCKNFNDDYNLIKVSGVGSLTFVGESTANSYHDRILIWTNSLKLNSVCGKYSQAADKSDLGTWRVPNFKEMALMYLEGLCTADGNFQFSCTYSYFDDSVYNSFDEYRGKYFGYYHSSQRQVLAMDVIPETPKVRCVRDVKVK